MAVAVTLVTLSTPVWAAADPTPVHIDPPDGLLRGIEYVGLAGSWHQTSVVEDAELRAELTIHLPSAGVEATLGPVVVLWQMRVVVADATFGDISERLIGPPVATAVAPTCDAAGACVLRVVVRGQVQPALDAANLEWVSRAGLSATLAVVRTFDDGTLWQVAKPDLPTDGDGGLVTNPSDTAGAMNLSRVFAASEAVPAEIPGDEFHRAADDLYDWPAAARAAMVNAPLPVVQQPSGGDSTVDLRVVLAVAAVLIVVGGAAAMFLRSGRRAGPP